MLLSKKYPMELLMVLLNGILVNNDSTSKIDHKNDEIKKKKRKVLKLYSSSFASK